MSPTSGWETSPVARTSAASVTPPTTSSTGGPPGSPSSAGASSPSAPPPAPFPGSSSTAPSDPPAGSDRSVRLPLLLLLLALGALARIWGNSYGLPHTYHPD